MAAFIALASWQGELPADLAERFPDPADFGLPREDDGNRDDPLLSGSSAPITDFEPDLEALRSVSTRIVLGIGEETGQALTARGDLRPRGAARAGARRLPGRSWRLPRR